MCAKNLSELYVRPTYIGKIQLLKPTNAPPEFEKWVLLVFAVESGFDPNAVSEDGALGLGQIMPMTGRGIAEDLNHPPLSLPADLLNVDRNIQYSSYYLYKMLTRFDNNVILMLVAYNAGPTRAEEFIKTQQIPVETAAYIAKLMFLKERYCK